ncbi:MAG: hypothetical protein ACI837_000034 [Crocinitomicaceae bacterium]|jgi:hypothetical protein
MKALKIVLISVGFLLLLGIGSLMYIGANSPDTYVYVKNEIPKNYKDLLRELSLIEADEKIQFLYSDALFSITKGVYVLTDKHLILYSEEWLEPERIFAFEEIYFLDITYDDSFFSDSYITVQTEYGMEIIFPVSSEKQRDYEFFHYLETKVDNARSGVEFF